MRNFAQLLFTLFCFCLPAILNAQDKDDSKYLAGAVPEVDGKVVFTKEFSIPGMSQDEIFDRMSNWMDARLKKNGNNSRIVLANKEKGQIVGIGDEWIVFSSSALSLDRTKIFYQLIVTCQPEKCTFGVEKIRFNYREGKEKYTAEEWITDKYAMNKSQTKLVRGLAKWRRKTVDFVDDLCSGVAESLSAADGAQEKKEEKKEEKSVANTGPMIIMPKKQVIPATPSAPQTSVTPAESATQPAATSASGQASDYKEIAPSQLQADAIQTGAGRLVIVIGEDPFNMTMMTANSGGSLGKVNGKPVIFSILSPDQPYEQVEKAKNYIIRFYPMGKTEPTVILECKKLPSPATMEGMPRTYIGEILKAMIK
ncbi:DUF4468 domain-containing protein [Bacteroides helcogenes]|uniref:DUF4468 domain-containing protein n=1 Tax=Bacteroides helcogenes (strain ATCC 35417 / DSM 20613 / JCM 6297 / CCUG 15421 / P 36-108) TaxID=693979 RepID=E6SP41_BACT6|nr:DUF4468 domain-containing protein [Bacteroides helcogenes]ADV43811.1 hypothetical protein Bache_1833 [Bacteroides helcogenes P 36-108]MDY5237442.1 DUF4468 domain-containing protein [Bacteroides helcogenes]